MVGKNKTAQELTITLLYQLDPFDKMSVYTQAKNRLAGDIAAIEQLELCTLMAGESVSDLQKYQNDFTFLAKTIVSRQRNIRLTNVTKKDIWRAMSESDGAGKKANENTANNTIDRIHDHARKIRFEEIIGLCHGFEKESNRLFWENQIYILFPELRTPDVTDGPVLNCLQAVWDSLSENEQETSRDTILPHRDWFDKLDQKTTCSEDPKALCLYDILREARIRAKVSQTRILDELEKNRDTYASYKKTWVEFEKNGYNETYPKNGLSRNHLIYLAVFLDMDYYTTVGMLAVAGFGFYYTESDTMAAAYLMGKTIYSKQEVLNKLHHW